MRIKLADVDYLCKLTLDIGMLTYLQQLLLLDKNTERLCENEFAYIYRYTQNCLIDKQTQVVLEIKNLLDREDFVTSESN